LKNLFLICDNYPLSAGEFFLDDEINTISPHFENIYILCTSRTTTKIRKTPQNVTILPFVEASLFLNFFFLLKGLFFIPLWIELFSLKRYNLSPSIITFKILWADFVKASYIKSIIESNKNNIPFAEKIVELWRDIEKHKQKSDYAQTYAEAFDLKRYTQRLLEIHNGL
jgi:hypothetical protein